VLKRSEKVLPACRWQVW